eukprot:2715394-Pyramimonas_sp.AAC.1
MAASTANKELHAILKQQSERLAEQDATKSGSSSEVDAVKKADGAWKAANNRHEQMISQVVRLRKQLAAAECKEREAALELARAAAAKTAATEALAQAVGVKPQVVIAPAADGTPSVFGIQMNMDVFDSFE